METFNFPYHTQRTEYPESGTRVQLGGGYIFTSPPNGPDLRRFTLNYPTMLYYPNEEPTSTNVIKNNTGVGAAAPSTLPTGWATAVSGTAAPVVNVIGTGVLDDIPYVDLQIVAGSAATVASLIIYPMAFNEASAAGGEVWTASEYVKLLSDSLGNFFTSASVTTRLYVQELNSGASASGQSSTILPLTINNRTIENNRYSLTRTLSSLSPSTAYVRTYLQFTWSPGVPVNFTVRVALPQLEKQPTATSPIYTKTAARTRTFGAMNEDQNASINLGALEAFWNRHKLYKSFVYPHPVYGNVECKFYSPLKIPEGKVNGGGAVGDFTIELIEIVQ